MTGPEQVSVNVADLRIFISGSGSASEYEAARTRLIAAIPEPEWEPTDDTLLRLGHAHALTTRCCPLLEGDVPGGAAVTDRKTKQVVVRLTAEMHDDLAAVSEKEGRTIAQTVRLAVAQYLWCSYREGLLWPEWEPTDDMRAKYRRGLDGLSVRDTDALLKAMYREGLIS